MLFISKKRILIDSNTKTNLWYMKEPWCVLLFSICKSMFAYSRLWGGWAAEEAETAGWRPPGSASSPSTASWTDPSWLRPLASWMTLGSGSDTSQVGRNRCERPQSGPVRPPPAGGRRAAVSREHCPGCAHTGTSEVSASTLVANACF